ncbi:MAG: DUF1013 domain-containing protein [Alphaproteobacteria bacterium]
MPKATAVWLIDNTTLTFEQIADFCGMHSLEIQGIADGEVAIGIIGADPVDSGALTREEIKRCEADPNARLEMAKAELPLPVARAKGPRYTPISKRQDRPDAIAWLVNNHPELTDAQISRLVGTTKPTINAIRERTHWNMPNLKPQSPVKLGLCTQAELVHETGRAKRAAERQAKREAAEKRKAEREAAAAEPQAAEPAAEPVEEPVAEEPAAEPQTSEAAEAETPSPPAEWRPHLPAAEADTPAPTPFAEEAAEEKPEEESGA